MGRSRFARRPGQAFRFSVSQSVQPETQTFLGAIQNSQTTYTSGTVNLSVVAGNLTIRSTTGQALQFSASQSVQAETQTFVGGIANSQTTYTSGTVSLSELGAITVRSTTGNQYQLSVNSQTAQTQNLHNVTLSGNTSGVMAQISSGTMTLAGGNNITVSQAGNAVTISGPNVGGAQTGISAIANSETTYTSGSVTLSALGAITIRSTTGQHFQLSVNSQTTQTQGILSAGVSTGGNTAGNTQVSTGSRLVIVGSNGITASQGTAAGATTITLSGITQSVQPETQTFVGGIAASNTTYTSGTVSITGVGGGVTVSSNTGQRVDISVAAQSVQTQNLHNVTLSGNTAGAMAHISSGTMTLAGGNNITLSQAGNAVTISGAAAGGVQTAISGLANSQTTYTSGTVSLSELGAITIRSTTGNQFQFSVNSQTTQTQGILSAGVSTGGNTAGNTTVNTGSRLVFVGSGNLTASQGTAAGASTITLSVAAQSVQPETQTFVGGIANSQTTYTSGTVSLSELGAITVRSTTGNQFQLSVNAQTTQTQGILSIGASNLGNTAGNTTVNTGSRLVLVGTNMVSLSQTTGAGATTLSINATQSVQTQSLIQALYDGANSITTGTVRLTNANGVSFSINAQTLWPRSTSPSPCTRSPTPPSPPRERRTSLLSLSEARGSHPWESLVARW